MENILLNMVKCCHCNQLIISKNRHDFVTCKCNAISVDGGRAYLKRLYKQSPDEYIEMSVVEINGEIKQYGS